MSKKKSFRLVSTLLVLAVAVISFVAIMSVKSVQAWQFFRQLERINYASDCFNDGPPGTYGWTISIDTEDLVGDNINCYFGLDAVGGGDLEYEHNVFTQTVFNDCRSTQYWTAANTIYFHHIWSGTADDMATFNFNALN